MVHRPKINPTLAFVLMPFKPPFDDYYEDIIKPAAKNAGLTTRKADEIYSTGPIIHDIWNQIWAATIVVADVTGKNPNVNYELGICHTLGVPTIIITQIWMMCRSIIGTAGAFCTPQWPQLGSATLRGQ